jgi:preprotein translocase subunit YajC
VIDTAWAQMGGGAASGGLNAILGSPIPAIILMFGVFYILVIRPQQQKQKEHQLMLANLKKNDEIVTSGGLYGRVMALADDVITVEIAPNVKVRVSRPQIANVLTVAKVSDKSNNDREKEKSK